MARRNRSCRIESTQAKNTAHIESGRNNLFSFPTGRKHASWCGRCMRAQCRPSPVVVGSNRVNEVHPYYA